MPAHKRNSTFQQGWLLDLPIKTKLYLIIGLLIGNIVLIISLGTFALDTLSSIRAAVAGEDLWAKATRTAMHSLSRYTLSLKERDYEEYLGALKIPNALDKANHELKKPNLDRAVLEQALLEGGIHPKDVPGTARLFIRFQRVPHVATALRSWAEAQLLMGEVQIVAGKLRASILSRQVNDTVLASYANQIDTLSQRITALEIQYCLALGEASRWATNVFLWIMIAGSLFLGLLSVGIAFYISSEIVSGISKISQAATQAAKGDLNVRVDIRSKDELGKLAVAFNHMTEGLGKLDALKTEFFANISHEFRTPLTLMLGPVEDLLSSPNPQLPRENLEIIYRNALRLLKLVNSLLDFSRLETGKVRAHYVRTDLSAFTQELASHFGSAVEKGGLEYEVKVQPAVDSLYVDRDMWEKIVFNLLSNALKFTLQGQISVHLNYDVFGVRLEVKDTGTGISDTEASHLFERFYRVQGTQSRSHEGSGIGLSLVREIVRLHGGTIEVQSTKGKGSTFTVRIPFGHEHLPKDQVALSEVSEGEVPKTTVRTASAYVQEASFWMSEKTASAATILASESASTERPRILVVDDNADMRAYVSRLLAPQWEVDVACDGSEALDSIRSRQPDLVLSDIMMPKLNGFELLQQLRIAPETRHLPIILLSARAGEESRVEGIEVGADDYLVKPFSARELLARVNTHLNLSRMRKEVATNVAIISRLKAEEKWLESALNLEPIPLLLIEPTTARVTFANRAADLMAGGTFPTNVPIEDYLKAYKWTDENDQVLPVDAFPSVRAARGEKIEGEIVVWHSPAGRFTIQVNADMLTEMHSHPKTILLAFQDVTTLSNAIHSRDEFLSIASHELKTPITSLKMQLQMAQRDLQPEKGILPSPERLAKMLDIFSRQIARLTSLVEDLLDVSRIQAGRLSLSPAQCNLSELLKQTLEQLSIHLTGAKCPVQLDVAQGIIGFWDRKRLEQVITNLIINATKYAPGKPIRVTLGMRQECASLSIQDFGPGIEKEKQTKLFERFERAISARNISGLGLGLFISRQIVKAHSGSIDLWSEPGKGSIFTVSLPLHSGSALKDVGSSNPSEEPPTPLPQKRIAA